VELERQWMQCGVANNKKAIFDSLPVATTPIAYDFKVRLASEMNRMQCSSTRQAGIWQELKALAQQNQSHPYLYSSTVDINVLRDRQEVVREHIEPFFMTRKFPTCPRQVLSHDQLTSPLYQHAFLLKYGLQCTTLTYK